MKFSSISARLSTWNHLVPTPRHWLFLFAAALLFRLALLALRPDDVLHNAAMGEMGNIARSIAQQGVFGDPYIDKLPTGPTAHCAPLFPFYLSLLFRISPSFQFFQLLEVLLSLVVVSATWASMPLLSHRLSLGTLPGLLAWAYGGFNPLYRWLDAEGAWDSNYSALCLVFLLPASIGLLGTRVPYRKIALLGLAWGLVGLMNPAVASTFAAAFAVAFLCQPQTRGLLWRQGLLIALMVVCLLLPWIIRTRLVLGGWVPEIRSNMGLELGLAYHDNARANLADNMLHGGLVRHPNYSIAETRRLVSVGELAYMAERKAEAKAWIAAHPWQSLRLAAGHAAYFWVPRRRNLLFRSAEILLSLMALAGLWSSRHQPRVFFLFLLLWIVYPMPYYLVQNDERYRWPINWSIVLMAGVFASRRLHRKH